MLTVSSQSLFPMLISEDKTHLDVSIHVVRRTGVFGVQTVVTELNIMFPIHFKALNSV